jgi:hypothetical protein
MEWSIGDLSKGIPLEGKLAASLIYFPSCIGYPLPMWSFSKFYSSDT